MKITTVSTPNAPAPGGHYSQAVAYNGLVFVAGQLAIDPQTGARFTGSIEEQTERCLKNIGEILKAAGSELSRVLKMTVYISDIELWPEVNAVYARVMETIARASGRTGEGASLWIQDRDRNHRGVE